MDNSTIGTPISMTFQSLTKNFDDTVSVEDYLRQHWDDNIKRLSDATLPIFKKSSQINGSCTLISKDLVLTSVHVLDDRKVQIGSRIGTVVFLGSVYKLDFAILQLNQPIDDVKPLDLDVEPSVGLSVQIFFDRTGKQFIRQFESQMLTNASRSNLALATTQPGESGSGRMSLQNGFVHSIHQGEGEALKVIDIYNILKSVSEGPENADQQNSSVILKKIVVRNLKYLAISQSSLALEVGVVAEEKPPVIDSILLDKPIKKGQKAENKKGQKPETVKFDYYELRIGGGNNRGIKINLHGVANSVAEYTITPDPHKYADYNKYTESFYEKIAIELGKYHLNNQQFPPSGKLTVFNVEYTLTR